MERMIQIRLGVIGALFLSALLVWVPADSEAIRGQASVLFGLGSSACVEGKLCVVFLDVGQGDATFIQSPTGVQMLIDGGKNNAVLRELSTVMGFFDKTIDVVLATHPDADHVGGLVDVFDRYAVDAVIRTENESDTAVWNAVARGITQEKATVHIARRGQRYDLGGGVSLEILFPDISAIDMESNMSSIVTRLTYGNTSFVFTGDSPKNIEEYLVLIEGEHVQSDVLKVGHHGSRTSTSELFIEVAQPTYAVISVGKDNRYGHPHVEVTDMLFNAGVEVSNTAEEGRITFVSDGTIVEVR